MVGAEATACLAAASDLDDDGSTSGSVSSDDTNEAFLEMLGLPALDGISTLTDGEHVEDAASSTTAEHAKHLTGPLPERSSLVAVAPLDVPQRCSRYMHHPSDVASLVIDNFLNEAECQRLIRLARELSSTGFHYVTEAAHVDGAGVTHMVKLQEANKHKLSVFEHPQTLDWLWDRMKPIITPHIGSFIKDVKCGPAVGLNPRLRVLRYDSCDNDVFEPHFDATTRVGNMTSLLTVLIYLNDGDGQDFGGGETCYIDSMAMRGMDTATRISPATGKVALFEHDLFHSSAPLRFGTKYVLRTDVLFELDASDNNAGVDIPRRGGAPAIENESDDMASTLIDVCNQLDVSEDAKLALDEIGLLDLTLDSLFAPGVSAVRQMMYDAMDKESADRLVAVALKCR